MDNLTMAKGEATFNSGGRPIKRFENKPIAKGDYPLNLQDKGLEVRRSQEQGPDAVPYISCRFVAEGTAAKEGQKDRLVFHNFFLSLKPGSDGVIMPDRGGGIVEFYRAHGEELNVPIKTLKLENPKPDGTTSIDYLDPEPILEQMGEWTDTVTQGHVLIEPGKDRNNQPIPGDPGRNKIAHFMVDEVAPEAEEEEAPPAHKNGAKKALPGKGKR